jgi:hypothetical protein
MAGVPTNEFSRRSISQIRDEANKNSDMDKAQ